MADDLGLPAVQLGVAAVHAEQVGGEQGGLVAAGAGAHLQDGALLVGGILGQQLHAAAPARSSAMRGLERGQLLPGQRRQLLVGRRIGDAAPRDRPLGLGLAQGLDGGDQRIELGELLGQLGVGGLVDAAG